MKQLRATVVLALTISLSACAQPAERLYYSSSNFSADIAGEPDSRPSTWGNAGVALWEITFTPPAGCAVEVQRIFGDLVAWPIGRVEEGKFAGVLLGLQTREPEGSVRGDWLADNTFLYIQDAVSQEPRRAPFNYSLSVRLPTDNKLVVKVAVWLNDTGRTIHIEPTFTLGYRFVDQVGNRCVPSTTPTISRACVTAGRGGQSR